MNKFDIEFVDDYPSDVDKMLHHAHAKEEAEKGVVCDYKKFSLLAKDGAGKVVGVLVAYTAYAEIYVDDLWVQPECRQKGIARNLLKTLEDQFKGKGYNNINLVTSQFQAPDFYEKCGFQKEFVRKNKKNPRFNKLFFVKFFEDEVQHQGALK